MDESDPAFLRNQASKCRRLADALFNSEDAAQLEALAHEYETQASAIEVELSLKSPSVQKPLRR